MRLAMHRKEDSAFMAALGGSIAELFYALAAVLTAEILYPYITDWEAMHYIGPAVMIGFGVYFLLSANKKFLKGRRTTSAQSNALVTGLKLGLLNPQVYLFYCVILLAYFQFGFKPENLMMRYLSFSLGAWIGFLLLLLLIIYLVKRQGRINNHHFRGDKVMTFSGIILIIAGLYQLLLAFHVF